MKCGLDMSKGVLSVQTLYGAANVFCGKNSERLNSVHLTVYIKMQKPPYISPLKNIEFVHFWKLLGSSERIYN